MRQFCLRSVTRGVRPFISIDREGRKVPFASSKKIKNFRNGSLLSKSPSVGKKNEAFHRLRRDLRKCVCWEEKRYNNYYIIAVCSWCHLCQWKNLPVLSFTVTCVLEMNRWCFHKRLGGTFKLCSFFVRCFRFANILKLAPLEFGKKYWENEKIWPVFSRGPGGFNYKL